MFISRLCDECKTPYLAEERYLNRGQGIYCSRECSGIASAKKRIIMRENNRTCDRCLKAFYRPSYQVHSKYVFCSAYCSSNSKLIQRGPTPTAKYKYCACCSRKTSAKTENCRECNEFIIFCNWWEGDNTAASDKWGEAKSFVKKCLIELRGDKCEVCGFDEKHSDGRSIIQMDHIDGNSENNLKENLQLLCPNHHALTETYGARNMGNGRAKRRKENKGSRSSQLELQALVGGVTLKIATLKHI